MNGNLNLCEILKDCPKGTKFYSPILGDCEFEEVHRDSVKVCVAGLVYYINHDATFSICNLDSEEPMLFPSRELRDWSKFKVKKPKFDPKTLKVYDKVLVNDDDSLVWYINIFSHIDNGKNCPYRCLISSYKHCIPYNDETKHLVGIVGEAPEYYRYWED